MATVCTLIINPVSGGYGEKTVSRVRETLERSGLATELLITRHSGDAAGFASRISREREDPFFVAGGGDGTVNGVVNGMEPGKGTLAVLPLGTANVLAKELGINSVDDAVARIVRGSTRPLKVGLLQHGEVGRRFILMAGIGVDGDIVRNVRLGEKRALGKVAYILSALRTLARWQSAMLRVTADGRSIHCQSLIVCNSAMYGGRFVIAPGADLFSQTFRLVCIRVPTRADFFRVLLSVVRGRVAACNQVEIISARAVTVAGERAVQLDGDYCCDSPVSITALPGFARLIV